ncbi:MAG: zinc ribbon domain-containing protein [Phycisphaerales bacterium]|nr:zinc ribbon domain-containing protein [Phycisphaerales bacterium]
MPTYDYHCTACDHAFEEFQSMTAPLLKKCPKCGKNKLERLIGTGAALMFKGSGFYITDYRSDSYKKSAEADKPASEGKSESKSETKSETKSESKPASTSESKPAKPAADKPKKKPAAKD